MDLIDRCYQTQIPLKTVIFSSCEFYNQINICFIFIIEGDLQVVVKQVLDVN
jgi:hypothetical protein